MDSIIELSEINVKYSIFQPEVFIAIPEWFNSAQVPFNSYWRDDTECKDNERNLYDTLMTDSFNKFACVWIYYPTTYNIIYDRVFKEDRNKFIIRGFSAMGYIDDIPSNHKTWNIEGIIGQDIVRAYFSIAHFKDVSTYQNNDQNVYPKYSPQVGDICYLTPNSMFYEVINVKTTVEQFLNRSHNYELTLRVFRDDKMTVSADSPTLINDPILTICASEVSATTPTVDFLSVNSFVDDTVIPIEYSDKPGEKKSDSFGGW